MSTTSAATQTTMMTTVAQTRPVKLSTRYRRIITKPRRCKLQDLDSWLASIRNTLNRSADFEYNTYCSALESCLRSLDDLISSVLQSTQDEYIKPNEILIPMITENEEQATA